MTNPASDLPSLPRRQVDRLVTWLVDLLPNLFDRRLAIWQRRPLLLLLLAIGVIPFL